MELGYAKSSTLCARPTMSQESAYPVSQATPSLCKTNAECLLLILTASDLTHPTPEFVRNAAFGTTWTGSKISVCRFLRSARTTTGKTGTARAATLATMFQQQAAA